MKFGVVIFPGSNCDRDVIHVLENVLGAEVKVLWHKDAALEGFSTDDCIVLPGGFSYGDYLRSGAIARFSRIMPAVAEFAAAGGFLFGICNGFQILCEAGLLPGALLRNENRNFICKNIFVKTGNSSTRITRGIPENHALKIPIAHAEGRYYADEKTLAAMEKNEQIIFRYCDSTGNISAESNPNGSLNNIAGICNEGKNVFGMMPHPERASEDALGNTDGLLIFQSLFQNAARKTAATVA